MDIKSLSIWLKSFLKIIFELIINRKKSINLQTLYLNFFKEVKTRKSNYKYLSFL